MFENEIEYTDACLDWALLKTKEEITDLGKLRFFVQGASSFEK